MNKELLIGMVAEKTGYTKKDSKAFVDAFIESVEEGLVEHGKVALTGFLTLEVKDTNARVGRNPKTGEELQIPAGKKVSVKVGRSLKEAIK